MKLPLSALAALLLAGALHAQITFLAPEIGTPYQTPAVSDAAAGLSGAIAWVRFTDGTMVSEVFLGTQVYQASPGPHFALTQFGVPNDRFLPGWTLFNTYSQPIASFGVHGASGDVVFDRTFGHADGTPGSGPGLDFTIFWGLPGSVTYSNIVNIVGQPAVGDLYESFRFDFALPLQPEGQMPFSQDYDFAGLTAAPIPSAPDSGSSVILLGLGLLALGCVHRRIAGGSRDAAARTPIFADRRSGSSGRASAKMVR